MTAVGRQAIVLAAGAGSRFGGGKLTALFDGRPLVLWAVEAALRAQVEGVSVVLGSDPAAVREALDTVVDPRLQLVEARDWGDGLSASLRAGLRALPARTTAVVVLLGDMPRVTSASADQLLNLIESGAPAARFWSSAGPAHPAAFAASVFPMLERLEGDEGARSVFVALGDAAVVVTTQDPGAVFDVDRPKDLSR